MSLQHVTKHAKKNVFQMNHTTSIKSLNIFLVHVCTKCIFPPMYDSPSVTPSLPPFLLLLLVIALRYRNHVPSSGKELCAAGFETRALRYVPSGMCLYGTSYTQLPAEFHFSAR